MAKQLKAIVCVALATLLLLWPMAVNRAPVLYPDTFGYLAGGRQIWVAVGRMAGIEVARPAAAPAASAATPTARPPQQRIGGRSPFYGAFVWLGWAGAGLRLAVVMQALWVALAVILLLDRAGIVRRRAQLAVVAALSGLTSLAFFSTTILPDVFAGLAAAALGMLVAYGRSLSLGERLFWSVTLLAGALFHSGILLTCAAVLAVVAVFGWRQAWVRCALPAVVLVAAFAGNAALDKLAARLTGVPVTPVPFLLARSLADGPAARLLVETCPGSGYQSCFYVPALPLTEEQFLWDAPTTTPWIGQPPAVRRAISSEANAIVVAAVSRYPAEQLAASASNAARQVVDLRLQKFARPDILLAVDANGRSSPYAGETTSYRGSLIWQRALPLEAMSSFWLGWYLVAGVLVAVLLATRRRWLAGVDDRLQLLVATLLAATLANAAIHGVLSLAVGRYQSRLSWLMLASAILLAHAVSAARRVPRGAGDGAR